MNLEQYRKQAKALVRAFRTGDEHAASRAAAVLGRRAGERFQLSDAQHVVAVEHGYRSWPDLKRAAAEPALWSAAALGRVDLMRRLHGSPHAGARRPTVAELGWQPGSPAGDDEQARLDEALFFAALNGRDDAVEWLLDRGAHVDGPRYLGVTPLHFAVKHGRSATIKLLLEHGANPSLRDRIHDGTPADWARHFDRNDLAGLIEGIDTGLEYAPGEPVRLRVDFRRFPYVLDDGRAVELAGRPQGWRSAAGRIAREHVVNVNRGGVVSLPVVPTGPGFDRIARRIAQASVALYEEVLDATEES